MLNPGIFSSGSIWRKLLLAILLVLLLAAGIIVSLGFDERAQEIEHAKKSAQILVRSIAALQEQFAAGAKQMLCTLSRSSEARRPDAQACHELFRDLLSQYPFYTSIGLTAPDGRLFADARSSSPGSINLSEQKHIRDVIATNDFSTGEYASGDAPKARSIHYSHPVLDEEGNLRAIVSAGFDLAHYASFITEAGLPEDSVVEILDHRGIRLCRFPEREAFPIGKLVAGDALKTMTGDHSEGLFETRDEDDVCRIYAFRRLRLAEDKPPYLYIRTGIGKDKILHEANITMLKSLIALGGAAFFIISFMCFLGNIALVKPINQLIIATRRLGKGETDARTGLAHTSEEIGRLAEAVDQMASLLEVKETEHKQLVQSLTESEARYRAIVQDQTELVTRFSPSGMLTFANEACQRCFSLATDELSGHTFWRYIPEEEHARLRAHIDSLDIRKPTGTIEHRVITKDGNVLWLQWVNRAVFDKEGGIVEYQGVGRDVSELKIAREDLAEATQRLRLAIDSGRMGIWDWTIQTDELVWDDRMFELYGLTKESLPAPLSISTWKAALHPDDLEASMRVLEAALDCNSEYDTEFRIVGADGAVRFMKADGILIRDEEGRPARMIGLNRDITNQKLVEEALRGSEREKAAILDGLREVIVEYVDPTCRIIWANNAMERATGISVQEMKGKRCFEFLCGLQEPCPGCTALAAAQTGEFMDGEVTSATGDAWIVGNNPIKDESGKVIGVVHVALDISKRKRAEEALRQSEEKYRMLFEHSPLGVLHFDKDGVVTSCNENMLRIAESSAERLVGFNLAASLRDRDLKAALSACMSGRIGHYEGVYRFVTGTAVKPVKINYAPVFSQNGSFSGGMAIVEDISERMRAHEALKESEAQLRFLSSRLLSAHEKERKRLASELHDSLGSTLSAIMIGLKHARKDMEAKNPAAAPLDMSISWTQHAIDEARRLMTDLRPSILDDLGLLATIGWLVKQQKKILPSVAIEEELDIEERDIPESLKVVIFRILQEALHNIAKHSRAKLVKLSLSKKEGVIDLSIEDNGVGFDPHGALHAQNEARGLGLTSMKERAELSGGSLSIVSAPGKGAVIRACWRQGS